MKRTVLAKIEELYLESFALKEKLFNLLGVGQAMDRNAKENFLAQVQRAHRDWEIALNNFNHAVEPDLVDYYIYDIEAAEKKYVYYIKRAKKENIEADYPVKDISYEGTLPV